MSIIYASFVPLLTLHNNVSQPSVLPKGSTQLNINSFFLKVFRSHSFIVSNVRNNIIFVVNFHIYLIKVCKV